VHFVENQKGDVTILSVKGNLAHKEDMDKLNSYVMSVVEKNGPKIILDLKNVSMISSLGIGGIIRAMRLVREKKGDVKLTSVNASVRKVFDITKLNEIIEIHNSSESALEAFALNGPTGG